MKAQSRAVLAETIGSFFLFATVIGSGIMAERLAGGNVAIALLGNTLATGAMLFVLITMLGPVSGAQFNPAVSLAFLLHGELSGGLFMAYVVAQLGGGILGVWSAHLMFDLPILQISEKIRSSPGEWVGEAIATFGLLLTIFGTLRARPRWLPISVALYITAAYWFTSSTSFANPAITVARSLSNSFAGIAPQSIPGFISGQLAGAVTALWLSGELFGDPKPKKGGTNEPSSGAGAANSPVLLRSQPIEPAGFPLLRAVLEAENLPVDDIGLPNREFFEFRDRQGLVGFGGLEGHGRDLLLRSVVVSPKRRSHGHGAQIIATLEALALARGAERLHLLTTSAVEYFRGLDYHDMARDDAPAIIRATPQFAGLCSANAVYLSKEIA
jgi:glycerol uptake facilitator-like aquaporin/N-acetylglutamate synthase-like GNAT family acetyltransferase